MSMTAPATGFNKRQVQKLNSTQQSSGKTNKFNKSQKLQDDGTDVSQQVRQQLGSLSINKQNSLESLSVSQSVHTQNTRRGQGAPGDQSQRSRGVGKVKDPDASAEKRDPNRLYNTETIASKMKRLERQAYEAKEKEIKLAK